MEIPEGASQGQRILEFATVCASAEGCRDYPAPTVQLTEGNTGSTFLFNAPWLTVQGGLDRETTPFYHLKFEISGKSEDIMFLDIRISDVNDAIRDRVRNHPINKLDAFQIQRNE